MPAQWRNVVARLGCSPAEAIALGILCAGAVVVLGLLWWQQRPTPVPLAPGLLLETPASPGTEAAAAAAMPAAGPTPTPAVLRVHVSGEVERPGVYSLPTGSRVVDALEQAGGATPRADLDRVNLAATLVDGVQVRVPSPEDPEPPPPAVDGATAVGGGGSGAGALVDLNTADATALEELPGVGPVTAQKIVDHRERIGRYERIEQLLDISGIGEATLAELEPHATVGG